MPVWTEVHLFCNIFKIRDAIITRNTRHERTDQHTNPPSCFANALTFSIRLIILAFAGWQVWISHSCHPRGASRLQTWLGSPRLRPSSLVEEANNNKSPDPHVLGRKSSKRDGRQRKPRKWRVRYRQQPRSEHKWDGQGAVRATILLRQKTTIFYGLQRAKDEHKHCEKGHERPRPNTQEIRAAT